jgi:hypothetical protein
MSKKFLIGTTGIVAVIVFAVHFQQKWEQNEMHKGVLRDIERVKSNKAARSAATGMGGKANE